MRAAASKLSAALASELEAVLGGGATDAQLDACVSAKQELIGQFTATPFRPTGLATPDQALANAVELLEWCTALLVDSVHERSDLRDAGEGDRELLQAAADVLRDAGALFAGGDRLPDLEGLEECRRRSRDRLRELSPDRQDFRTAAQLSFHAHAIAVTVLALGADAAVAARLVDTDWIADARTRWFGPETVAPGTERGLQGLTKYTGIARRHASVRSVWFINSLRGALALALAVLIADI